MLLSLFLLMLAADAAPQSSPNNVAPTLPAAIQLLQEGHDAEALAALQKIVAANPNDHLARLWIAQVHDRMGHPELAEAVYRSVALEDPRNVDAITGIGVTLMEQDRIDEAIGYLERAEQLTPENPSVLVALGEAQELAGRTDRSVVYLQRVVAISPTEDHRLALERARFEHGHRYESQTYGEWFNGATRDTRGSDLSLNIRTSETLRLAGRAQLQTKFGRYENRFGGGAQWRWKPATTFTGQVLVGTGNRVLPQADYLGQMDYSHRRVTGTATGRYFDFFGARVVMVSPAVTYAASDTWTFGLRYAFTSTDTSLTTGVRGNTAQLQAAHQIHSRVWVQGGYARGVENFDNFSTDRIGDFRANTGSVGVQVVLPSLTSIVGVYDHQRRPNGVKMNRLNVLLVQSF
jgi:Tfp pilus assembly protein PilF